ncbi:copper amine oxidase N-terminal domain-containing protein [Paenibacillus sp. JCM 10914]|uniref:copper amine oxidase N-terminal domain-containing protein n=1 Tax=Paenibacillus sp. JCM 10914 TaxID=1236974 RepID=UPI0003CCA367|nr:copper amine oxidase N-terminal domain-containing protein [Paenibacillus sp. JCM 10914]GAE05302.1 hypothetical membrane protein [Paenibacillus sp. JCM 10914]
MNKKIALSGLIAATAASMMFTPPLEAATTQSVQFQMNQLSYSNDSGKHALTTAPYELRGHSMVPLRALATSLGSNVSWNQSNQTTTLSGPSYDDIKLTVNSNIAIDADGRQIKLPERVTLVKGSVFVPVRSMAVLMKAQLKWESGTRTVTVTKPSDAANHIQRSYNFAADKQGWKGGFSDLPVDYDPDIYELEHTRNLFRLKMARSSMD